MATTSTGAAPSGAASGRSGTRKSKATTTKTVKVRGITLQLPPTVPLRVLNQMVKVADAGEDARTSDLVGALELVLGAEQMEKVWDIEVDSGNGTLDALQTLFAEIIDKVFTASGITPGESPASP